MKRNNKGSTLLVLILVAAIVAVLAGIGIYLKNMATAPGTALPTAVPAKAEALNVKQTMPVVISIPEGAGHVVEGYKAPGDGKKIVVHLQDIHTNYEAQKNASRILEALVKDQGLKLIMVEGGWGDVGLAHLRYYPGGEPIPKERREQVADEYLKAGKISGEEYLDIASDHDLDLEGLEDEALYKANLDTFFEIEKFRAQGAQELKKIQEVADKLKAGIYPQQINDIEKAKRDYDAEKISLAAYYKQINDLGQKTNQDMAAYPNFANFIKVSESEKSINFPQVEKERTALIEKLSKALSKEELSALVTKSLEFRLNKLTPAEYHEYLLGLAKKGKESMDAYPNLKKYVEYIKSHEDINTTALFEEADLLLSNSKDRLITTSAQKKLNSISNGLRVLDNFLNLKLVPSDFVYYREHKNEFATSAWVEFLQQEAKKHKIDTAGLKPAATADQNLATLVKFYDLANQRDDAFLANTTRLMDEKNANIAVFIAGGFHTSSIKDKFKEKGLSYVVIAPHTTQTTDPEQYRYILKYKSGREE